MNEIAIQSNETRAIPARERADDARLEEACREFEGIMLSIILKEGMKSAWGGEGESETGSENMMDFALEQASRALARQGAFGLAEAMLEQMKEQG